MCIIHFLFVEGYGTFLEVSSVFAYLAKSTKILDSLSAEDLESLKAHTYHVYLD